MYVILLVSVCLVLFVGGISSGVCLLLVVVVFVCVLLELMLVCPIEAAFVLV